MDQLDCKDGLCGDEGCYCRILHGPISIRIEGGAAFELETACMKKIEVMGLTQEQLLKVRSILDFLSKLKKSQTNPLSNEEQIQALREAMSALGT